MRWIIILSPFFRLGQQDREQESQWLTTFSGLSFINLCNYGKYLIEKNFLKFGNNFKHAGKSQEKE